LAAGYAIGAANQRRVLTWCCLRETPAAGLRHRGVSSAFGPTRTGAISSLTFRPATTLAGVEAGEWFDPAVLAKLAAAASSVTVRRGDKLEIDLETR